MKRMKDRNVKWFVVVLVAQLENLPSLRHLHPAVRPAPAACPTCPAALP